MAGIRSFGAYIPMLRLPFTAIAGGGRKAAGGSGEKAVAYFDEDAVTMGVAAGADCLRGIDTTVWSLHEGCAHRQERARDHQ